MVVKVGVDDLEVQSAMYKWSNSTTLDFNASLFFLQVVHLSISSPDHKGKDLPLTWSCTRLVFFSSCTSCEVEFVRNMFTNILFSLDTGSFPGVCVWWTWANQEPPYEDDSWSMHPPNVLNVVSKLNSLSFKGMAVYGPSVYIMKTFICMNSKFYSSLWNKYSKMNISW